jgi:hypothetical protein
MLERMDAFQDTSVSITSRYDDREIHPCCYRRRQGKALWKLRR